MLRKTIIAFAFYVLTGSGCSDTRRDVKPQRLADTEPTATPAPKESEPELPPPGTLKYWKIERAEPEIKFHQPEQRRAPSDKCLDGSPLTVTGSDSNQTDYKCGSGSVGAYTN